MWCHGSASRSVTPFLLTLPDGEPSGLSVGIVRGSRARFRFILSNPRQPPPIVESEDTVGAMVSDGQRRLFFIPAVPG